MFDFEKLEVYAKANIFNLHVQKYLLKGSIDGSAKSQLRRASLSIALNIAEGSGRNGKADKRHFFVIARGSTFECVAILDILKDEGVLEHKEYSIFYSFGEELSKMLYAMIRKLD